jgi:hypothetical protein
MNRDSPFAGPSLSQWLGEGFENDVALPADRRRAVCHGR